MKKILSVLLTITIVLSVALTVPLSVSAVTADEVEGSYTNNDYSEWTYELIEYDNGYRILQYNGDQSKVQIPSEINNIPVKEIGESAFANNSNLTNLILPESVITVYDSAFLNCINLETVYYTGDIDAWCSMMIYAGNDSLITAHTVHNAGVKNDASGTFVAEKMYEDSCIIIDYFGNVSKIQIPSEINNIPVTEIGESAFANNSNLTSLILPESITIVHDSAFLNCTNLNTVYYTGDMDDWCSVMIHAGNDSLITAHTVHNAGVKNDASGTFVAEKMYVDSCIIIDYFGNASKIQIPSEINNIPVTEIAPYVFENNSNLTSLILPESITIVHDSAFLNCTNLNTVYYTGDIDAWCSVMIHAGNDSLITAHTVHNAGVKNDASGTFVAEKMYVDSCIIIDYFGNASKIQIPSEINNIPVTEIAPYVFANNSNLTSIILPESVIKVHDSAFLNCTNLETVYYTGDIDAWCSMMIHAGNDSLITAHTVHNACVKNDASGTFVAEKMYEDSCIIIDYFGNASKIQIPSEINNIPVTEIAPYVFENNSNLTSLILPESITIVHDSAFLNCTNLNTVYYTGDIDDWYSIMLHYGNDCLQTADTVVYNAGVKNDASGTFIVEKVFENGCIIIDYFGNASKIQIPSEIDNIPVVEIAPCVFENNTNLTKIILPKSVIRVHNSVFLNCTNLSEVYYTGDANDWCSIMIHEGNDCLTQAMIYHNAYVKNDDYGTWVYDSIPDDFCIIIDYFGNANEIQIPSKLDSKPVTDINLPAFENNGNLTALIIPKSVIRILGMSTLNGTNISDVYYEGSEYQWWNSVYIEDRDTLQANVTMHYDYVLSIKGDLSGDGKLAVDDVIYVLKGIVGDIELTDEQIQNADLNEDGQLTVLDAVMLQRLILEV